ncbi:hypothetical protein BZA70DRAFT_292183 [Myxozyma melibiosi]|uniref:ATP-dependent DNA ligase family profile domain-containing protein n=1 Tax=Myxozyma melibiosi TaxID=54550 RepID=A0ABR1EYH6_9ASCO
MALPFSSICDLFRSIEKEQSLPGWGSRNRVMMHYAKWCIMHRDDLLADKNLLLCALSCLFPELRTDRRYGLSKLGTLNLFGTAAGIRHTRRFEQAEARIKRGEENASVISDLLTPTACATPPSSQPLVTVAQVDEFFATLAGTCRFSAAGVYCERQETSPEELLQPMIEKLQPNEIKWLIRMLNRNMQPVTLPVDAVLRNIHFALPMFYSFYSSFPDALDHLFSPPSDIFLAHPRPDTKHQEIYKQTLLQWLAPTVGVPVRIPECYKGRNLNEPTRRFNPGSLVSVETKYDGERMQIHIDIDCRPDYDGAFDDLNEPPEIIRRFSIFSKSGRNSTKDRSGVLDAIRKGLRLSNDVCCPHFSTSIILEAEMVVYDRVKRKIAPFHRITDHVTRGGSKIGAAYDKESIKNEQLMVVFFDVLEIDGISMLNESYEARRGVLEKVVSEVDGHAMLAERTVVRCSESRCTTKGVAPVFERVVGSGGEGVVVKLCDSTYLEASMKVGNQQWIKLKKDYLAGRGDTEDFCVIGAGVDTKRAVERKMGPGEYNVYYIGCMKNKEEVQRFGVRPMFEVIFTVKYLLHAADQARMQDMIRTYGYPYDDSDQLDYDITLHPYLSPRKPLVLFYRTQIFEIMSAGFDKPSGNNFYVPRWPRVVKIHEDGRSWVECVGFDELQNIADACVQMPVSRVPRGYEKESEVEDEDEDERKAKRAKTLTSLEMSSILNKSDPWEPSPLAVSRRDEVNWMLGTSIVLASYAALARTKLIDNYEAVYKDPIEIEYISELNRYRQIVIKRFSYRASRRIVLLVDPRRSERTHDEIAEVRKWIKKEFRVRRKDSRTTYDFGRKTESVELLVVEWRVVQDEMGSEFDRRLLFVDEFV